MANNHDNILRDLEALQSNEVTILSISEPISTAIQQGPRKRVSDVSHDAFESPTPSSLETDLSHYKVSTIRRLERNGWLTV